MTIVTNGVQSAVAASRSGRRTIETNVRLVFVQSQAGGVQEISRILGSCLRGRGCEVHHAFLFRRNGNLDDYPNTFFCAQSKPSSIVSLLRMFIALVRLLKRLDPDVVVCFQHFGNIIGTLAAWIAGSRTVIVNRVSPRISVPRYAWWLEHALGLAGLFTRIVVNSEIMENSYRKYPRWFRRRIVLIEHGFEPKVSNLTREAARDELRLPADVTLLGCAARLHPTKNLGAAIRLLPDEPSWHLALAGYGPGRADLTSMAESLGVRDRLHFVGELPAERIGIFFKALDVFVFPTLAETFGLAVVEAANASVPIVANDLDIIRWVLAIDGKPCALIVDVNDTKAFAEAVRCLIENPELRATLCARGAQLSSRFSRDAMTDRFLALINDVNRP